MTNSYCLNLCRPLGGGKCNNHRDAPKLVGSVDACAHYANTQTNVTGFCVEENSCYVSKDLDVDLLAVPVSTMCESGKGMCSHFHKLCVTCWYVCMYVCMYAM
jgi:hypothetical protein